MKAPENNPLVYLSYSNEVRDVALQCAQLMEAAGVRCWYADRDLIGGVSWREATFQAIKAAKVFVALVGRTTNNGPWNHLQEEEAGLAARWKRR